MSRHVATWLLVTLIAPATLCANGGCSSSGNQTNAKIEQTPGVPEDARNVDAGVGILRYTAHADGSIYVFDVDARSLLFDHHLTRGQEFVLVPDRNLATVDDRKVFDHDIRREHTHRLYFLSDDRRLRAESSNLPRGATRVAAGHGELSYRAEYDGRTYVYDAEEQRALFNEHLAQGQAIVVEPDRNRIAIDGRTVSTPNLSRENEYRIYFDKD